MNSKHLKGLPVISVAEGEKLGTVARAYVDAATKQIVGFAFTAGGGLLGPDSEPKLDRGDLQSLGPDALTLHDRAAVRGAETNRRFGELVEIGDLANRAVLTAGGTAVGRVASLEFDEQTFAVREIEISPGFFKGHTMVPVAQILAIGPDFVIVADAVGAAGADAGERPAEHRWVVEETAPASG